MQGIYKIQNTVNGKIYVGASTNIKSRFYKHTSKKNIEKNKCVLAKAFRKYSIHSFSFQILEIIDSKDVLFERERYWIKKLKPEYNMTDGGAGRPGCRLSEDVKQMLSTLGKIQWTSKSDIEKQCFIKNNLKGPKIGHKVSTSTRQKLRNANLGKSQSNESKRKRSDALKISAIGNNNGNKKITQINNGVDIKTYPSIKAAAIAINIHPSNITKVLKGAQKSAGGYQWKYGN